jgi:uncharacterized membrane protein
MFLGGLHMKINLKLPKIRLPSREKVYDFVSELAILAGFLMLGRGIYMIYKPAMFIICGIGLMWFGFPKTRRAK